MIHSQTKALNLFNEALQMNADKSYADLNERKEAAKKICYIQISNIKVAFYEAETLEAMPNGSHQLAIAFYTKVYLIISKF
jgi:predicted transcriptional regulator